jgi:hypothetical protein
MAGEDDTTPRIKPVLGLPSDTSTRPHSLSPFQNLVNPPILALGWQIQHAWAVDEERRPE